MHRTLDRRRGEPLVEPTDRCSRRRRAWATLSLNWAGRLSNNRSLGLIFLSCCGPEFYGLLGLGYCFQLSDYRALGCPRRAPGLVVADQRLGVAVGEVRGAGDASSTRSHRMCSGSSSAGGRVG